MLSRFKRYFRNSPYNDRIRDIDPDEIFLDSQNLPHFDVNQFEWRLEKSISARTFMYFGGFCFLIFCLFFVRSIFLQVVHGGEYLEKSNSNMLRYTFLFPHRGVIYDRNNTELAWNVAGSSTPEFSLRKYDTAPGLSDLIGYLKYPEKDSSGFYYNEDFLGEDGVEKFFNDTLSGTNGLRIIETDANGNLQSQSVVRPPADGSNITLSVDSDIQTELFNSIKGLAGQVGFTGGAGVIMNVQTGEVIAMTSFPEYNSQILTDRKDTKAINQFLTDKSNPFLDRTINGLYTPGSIVKPFMAIAALTEKVIDPTTKILSTGSISLPNPYDPAHPSVFKDWRAQGWVDMEQAIAVSSDVYFYEIGGGYQDQKGLGITMIDKYMSMFGFGSDMPEGFFNGSAGTIPSPAWKAENFNGENWLIGDTYHTAIGQYGWQVTPIQIVRAVASIANNGKIINPSIILGGNPNDFTELNTDKSYFQIVREGMKMDVESGVASGLNVSYMTLGAKTGTAQLGLHNQFVNSWVTGFFPYDNPKYAFAVVMEQGPAANTLGGVYVMRQVFDWMEAHKPEYLK